MTAENRKPERTPAKYWMAWARIGPMWFIVGKNVQYHSSRYACDHYHPPGAKSQRVTKVVLREGDHPTGPSSISEVDMIGFDEWLNEVFQKPLR
jgi:hypothetical protein